MKILVANQKGGVGKTSLAILMANYMSMVKKENIACLDFDFQASFYNQYTSDKKLFDNSNIYKVTKVDVQFAEQTLQELNLHKDYLFIMDSPGNIDDENILNLFKNVDVLVCPFNYERKNFESTYYFASVVNHLNKKLKIFFIPNNVKKNAKYKIKDQVREALSKYGQVFHQDIYDRVSMARINFFNTTSEQAEITDEFFSHLHKYYLLNK